MDLPVVFPWDSMAEAVCLAVGSLMPFIHTIEWRFSRDLALWYFPCYEPVLDRKNYCLGAPILERGLFRPLLFLGCDRSFRGRGPRFRRSSPRSLFWGR